MIGSPSSSLPSSYDGSKYRKRNNRSRLPRFCASQTYWLGILSGLFSYWLLSEIRLAIGFGGSSSPELHMRPVPHEPPDAGGFHAIIIPAGGQHPDGPPPHVLARLERAVSIYKMSAEPKPYVITTAWGTPHKPCPHDTAGFERHEASDNAKYLLNRGVPPERILEESVSLETVGNAYFTRVLHTDVRSLRKLAIINNHFHMERTRNVFSHVFAVPPREGVPSSSYEIEYVEVEDRLPKDVLEARLAKEALAAPKFAPGSSWQEKTADLRKLHEWVHMENTAYASVRLLTERKPIDPELLKSY